MGSGKTCEGRLCLLITGEALIVDISSLVCELNFESLEVAAAYGSR